MKITVFLMHALVICGILAITGLLALIPMNILNIVGNTLLIAAIIMGGVFCILALKKWRELLCVLAFLGIACPTKAVDLEVCDAVFLSSTEQGNLCVYAAVSEELGPSVCKYMKSFDPTKVVKDKNKLMDAKDQANQIVQAYSGLSEAYQKDGNSCKLLTDEDQGKSTDERRKILRNNSSPICCALAMQSLYQIYTSQHPDKQIVTVPEMLGEKTNQCWPCDIVYLLITLANTLAYRSAPSVCSVGLFFLKWFFIFWLLFKIAALFVNRDFTQDKKGNPQPYDAKKFFKELLARLCWVSIVALILTDTASQLDKSHGYEKMVQSLWGKRSKETVLDDTYARIINPVFQMISAVGISIAEELTSGKHSFYAEVAEQAKEKRAMTDVDYCTVKKKCGAKEWGCNLGSSPMYQYLLGATGSSHVEGYVLDTSSQGKVIDASTTRNLLCLTQLSYQGLAPVSAAGSIISTYAIKNGWNLPFPLPGSIPIMPQVFYGLMLTITCWLLGVAVGFRLIDIMVRVAMMVMLCPIFMVLAVFPATRDKAITAVKFFVSAVMGFVEIALAVGITVPMFYSAIAGERKDDLIKAMVAKAGSTYVPNLYEEFSQKGARFFLFTAVVGWMAFKMLGTVSNFFEKIFDLGGASARNVASGATMSEGFASARQFVGDTYDISQKVPAGKYLANTKAAKYLANTKMGRGIKNAKESVKSAGKKLYEGAKNTKEKIGEAGGKVVDKAGKALGSGMQKGGKGLMRSGAKMSGAGYGLGAIIGVPMMAAGAAMHVAGTTAKVAGSVARSTARGAWKVAKKVPKFALDQAKQGVYNFFHPDGNKKK